MKELIFLLLVLSFSLQASSQDDSPYYQEQSKTPERLFIDQLEPGDTLKLVYQSQGCFHFERDSIQILKSGDTYIYLDGEKERNLQDQHLIEFRQFEERLYKINDNGCTTLDEYVFVLHGKRYLYLDGSCAFDGFDSIVSILRQKMP